VRDVAQRYLRLTERAEVIVGPSPETVPVAADAAAGAP
jgi:hypothetical protein